MRSFRYAASVAVLLLLVGIGGCRDTGAPVDAAAMVPARAPGAHGEASLPADTLLQAIRDRAHEAPVEGEGTVVHVLRDDTHGTPHQKFLVRVADGSTVLVAHNVALAPRLDGLAEGDVVAFRGSYVWTPKGGTVHWTHRDPRGEHRGGWLRWRGRTYE